MMIVILLNAFSGDADSVKHVFKTNKYLCWP